MNVDSRRTSVKIQFSPPDITDLELRYVEDALRSGWITTGPKTKEFETRLSAFYGTPRTVCVNSATAAMELVLREMGIGPGDEVITSSYTYSASASIIEHVGAKIVLVDVAKDSYFMDYEQLEQAITERTKAIIPVDIGGVMADYDKVYEAVRSKKHLYHPTNTKQALFDHPVILADAAHSIGSSLRGKCSGTCADFTAFSFHAVKNLTTSEGGAITWLPRDGIEIEDLYQDFQLYSLHGQSKDALSKMRLGSWEYDIVFPGYKCNMIDILAALGLAQLERFPAMSEKRHQTIAAYDQAFLPLGLQSLQHQGEDHCGNGHLYLLRIPGINEKQRNKVIDAMAEKGVACNVHFKPLPMFTGYKAMGFDIKDYPNAYNQYCNEITLPTHTLLTEEQVAFVIDCMTSVLKKMKIV